MLAADLFQETYFALTANKARSALTILGIVIGIGAVIVMVAIGQGAKETIHANIQSLGSNLIIVMPGMQRGVGMQISQGRGSAQTLTSEDAEAITKEILFVKRIAPELSGRYQVVTHGANTNTQVVGTVPSYLMVRNLEIAEGSFISDEDVKNFSKVAVLGPVTRDDLFGEGTNPIGQVVRIKNIDFKIIGITKPKGGTGFGNQDDRIFIPLSTAQRFLVGSNYLSAINIEAENQNSMSTVQEQVNSLLLTRHHISDPQLADFSVINQADIVSVASSITNTLTILLGSIASISLIVGGIGIMNMMLTTVTERIREIGLRKAIGAKKKEISQQFLTEAVFLTIIGGIFGIILGWLISLAINQFANIAAKVSFFSVLLAFGVSAAVGIIFGYYPAKKAANLNPIEALRYE